jgi:hypothetical protein
MNAHTRKVALSAAALALAAIGFLTGCDKGAPAGDGPAAAGSGAPAAGGGCDIAAFDKEQDEKGRNTMKDMEKKFTGCKFEGYDDKTKVATYAGNGKKLRCVNDPKPAGVAPGDLVDVSGKVDGAGFVTLYGCVTKKS